MKVDNTRRADALPALNTDWWNYGGLTRGVRLVETPRVFVRDAVVQLAKENTSVVRGFGAARRRTRARQGHGRDPRGPRRLHGHDRRSRERPLRVPGAHACPVVSGDAAPLRRRDPQPATTACRIASASARSPRAAPDILLNGKPIFLRGIALHEEALGRGGRATTRAQAEALLTLAKELGCNFVRLAHYPHGDEMTRAADAWACSCGREIPVYWTIAWSNASTLATARAQLAEEIARDHNRASVILWSVGNETPVSEARNRFLRTLVEDVRAADDTRLVTAALRAPRGRRAHARARRSAGRRAGRAGPQRVRRLVRRRCPRSATRSPGGPPTTSRSSSANSGRMQKPACTATR